MSLKIQQIDNIKATENYIRGIFENEGSGHDWWHIFRVRNLALIISQKEGGDKYIIEMASLLHDLDDWKLNGKSGISKTRKWLNNLPISDTVEKEILEITEQVSFKGAGVKNKAISLESKIVQDADRLDAIGAIGVARTFAYGGNKGRLIYHPEIKPELHNNFKAYQKTTAPTINHFYEKLLLLKDRMNTITAIKLAEKRHHFMEIFLKQFYVEWEGKIEHYSPDDVNDPVNNKINIK